MIVNRKVLDLSHYNTVNSWARVKGAGILGIVHKATEGTSYTDDRYAATKAAALDAGLLWGAYHFANNSSVASQVDHFLAIAGIHDEMLYALDWEDEPNGRTMNAAQARDFLTLVDGAIGKNRCVVYSGNRAKEALGATVDPFFGEHRLWLAHYNANPRWQVSWQAPWLWQYSDGVNGPNPHGCPGVSGEVDTNSFAGTDEQLHAQWSGVAPPAPPPDVPTLTMTIEPAGSVRVIVIGALD